MGGSDFTLSMALPVDSTARDARLKQLRAAATQGGKFLIATQDGAWKVTASRFKLQHQVKLPFHLRESSDSFTYLKVLGGKNDLG